jgi:hypothetical protein
MTEMILHQFPADGAQSFVDGRYLRHDVGAVAVFLDHALKAANLALDPLEPLEIAFPRSGIHGYRLPTPVSMHHIPP